MAEVSILMCTYNGEKYLKEQLDSFSGQTFSDWDLLVSDDGSVDKTLEIIAKHSANQNHCVKFTQGPGLGFASNFFHALRKSSSHSAYFAFSDQDDIWLPEKLQVAVEWLSKQPKNIPIMYCGITELVDQDGFSYYPPRYFGSARGNPLFSTALVQPISSGNTMVFNKCARDLLLMCEGTGKVPFHDWWTHIMVLGAGGRVFFDSKPHIKYRQHGNNTIGGEKGLKGYFSNLKNFCSKQFRNNVINNVDCLKLNQDLLSDSNRQILFQFNRALHGSLSSRYVALHRSGVRRQGWTNLALWLGPLFRFF